jgi:4-carboxymuconolactone decarboxylase
LVALSAAVAAGDAGAVRREAESAMDAGAPGAAVYEALLQSYLFLGFPRAIEGFFAAQPVLEARGAVPGEAAPVDLPRWERAGAALCRRVYGTNYERLLATMRRLSPDLAAWMIQEGYGKTLSRPALEPAAREYCVIAILAVTGMTRQLRSHAIGAVNVGGSRAGVREAIELSRPWAGARGTDEALRVAGLSGAHAPR